VKLTHLESLNQEMSAETRKSALNKTQKEGTKTKCFFLKRSTWTIKMKIQSGSSRNFNSPCRVAISLIKLKGNLQFLPQDGRNSEHSLVTHFIAYWTCLRFQSRRSVIQVFLSGTQLAARDTIHHWYHWERRISSHITPLVSLHYLRYIFYKSYSKA